MRLCEFDNTADSDARLLSVLNYLQSRARDKGLAATLKTQSLINLVRNAGDDAFSYDALVATHERNPAVKNLIKNFNKDTVLLYSPDAESTFDPTKKVEVNPEQTIDTMAKRALGRRR